MRDTLALITDFISGWLRSSTAPAAVLHRSIAAASAHIAAGGALAVTVKPADVMARLRLIAAAPVLIESGLEIHSQP